MTTSKIEDERSSRERCNTTSNVLMKDWARRGGEEGGLRGGGLIDLLVFSIANEQKENKKTSLT